MYVHMRSLLASRSAEQNTATVASSKIALLCNFTQLHVRRVEIFESSLKHARNTFIRQSPTMLPFQNNDNGLLCIMELQGTTELKHNIMAVIPKALGRGVLLYVHTPPFRQ